MAVSRIHSQRNGFRISMVSGVPYETADVVAAPKIYLVPAWSDCISLYYPTNDCWELWQSAQIELNLNGLVASGSNYDVFVYVNRATGVLSLELAVWTSDNVRATAIDRVQGIRCKNGATDRRYVGTIRGSAANVTEDSLVKRFCYNFYSQRLKVLKYTDSTPNVYDGIPYQQWRFGAIGTAAKVEFVLGQIANSLSYTCSISAQHNNNGRVLGFGAGLNTVAAPTTTPLTLDCPRLNEPATTMASDGSYILIGYNYLSALQSALAAGATATWNQINVNAAINM